MGLLAGASNPEPPPFGLAKLPNRLTVLQQNYEGKGGKGAKRKSRIKEWNEESECVGAQRENERHIARTWEGRGAVNIVALVG